MKKILDKLCSRKLWAALVGVIVGVAMVFGLDEGTVTDVAGAVTTMVSVAAYILGEAGIDASAARQDRDGE